jgi:1-acyl-sn-glycerol-3-phosphate acyltransferase
MATEGSPAGAAGGVFWRLLNVVQLLFTFVWCAFWISFASLVAIVTFNKEIALWMARRCWAWPLLKFSGCRFQCDPLPDFDWKKPHIYVMNHQSMIDIPAAFYAIPANIRFVAKEQLKWVPFIGLFIWVTGMIFVDRSRRARAVASLEKAAQRIRSGASIIAYPEGTRSSDGRILPFKKGPFVLALAAGVPIVPIAIEGSGKVSPKGRQWAFRPHEVRMKVGRPIPTAGLKAEDRDPLIHQVRAEMISLHREIGGKGGVDADIAPAGVEGIAPAPSSR